MTQGTQNGPGFEIEGPSHNTEDYAQSTGPTACEHLAAARHWLTIAENNWTDAATCQATAKLAELHLMLADRVADLGACDV